MTKMHYALIRFIPDMARMEPTNVGIVLQGAGQVDVKLSPHAAKRKDIETQIYQRWRKFFEEEIKGESVPLFQPPKTSISFLHHLESLCEHTIKLSNPLLYEAADEVPFDDVLQALYKQLVEPSEQAKRPPARPTSKYRQLEEQWGFRRRGMRKHPYLSMGNNRRWNAYRQMENGENIVIDKVEVNREVGLTADEIQKLSSGVESFIEAFLGHTTSRPKPKYVLIADHLTEKFTDQTESDFSAMREELDYVVSTVNNKGGRVIRDLPEAESFANDLNNKLPPQAQSDAIDTIDT